MVFEGQVVHDMNGNIVYKPHDISLSQIYNLGFNLRGQSEAFVLGKMAQLFLHGGRYDFQRESGPEHVRIDRITPDGYLFHPEFVSFSTIAIGIFGEAAGISKEFVLKAQNYYAGALSNFAAGTPMSADYANLPVLNVENTKLGYHIADEIALGH